METPQYKSILNEAGALTRFAGRFFSEAFRPRYEFREFLRQCFFIGYKSLGLVAITTFIIGLVITMQSRPTLVEFGAEAWLPQMISVSLVREIVPVITALICAGKIGSGIGAELGSMKVTDQIDAMEVSATNPFKYLVVSRVYATTVMVPFLMILGCAVSLYGGYLGASMHGGLSWRLFWHQVFDTVEYSDIFPAIIKTFVFGFAIGIVGCYKGYSSERGTEGVGLSANSAVVISSLLVFIIDLIAVQFTDVLGLN
ncbi:MAG TPA: ABC transporter permease [Bacteroidia bacterium]|nr:ABC transporter permease [Bacteroidia bacterium]